MQATPLPYELTGNANSKQLLVFIHGWPDKPEVWDQVVPEFEKEYQILSISYPNHSSKETLKWGNDIPVTVQRIKATIDAVNKSKKPINWIAHDWGAIYTYFFDASYPGTIADMITLDVSPYIRPTLGMVAYQLVLFWAFLIGGKIGNLMTQAIVKYVKYDPPYKKSINWSWNYHYYYAFAGRFKAAIKKQKSPMDNYKPSCNIAYIWAKNKPYHFHTEKWLKLVRENPDNLAQELNCGHWIQREQPSFLIDLIKKRIRFVASKIK